MDRRLAAISRTLSRRVFLKRALGLGAIASSSLMMTPKRLVWAATRFVPPRWLKEASDIADRIQTPRISDRRSVLTVSEGCARQRIQDAIDGLTQVGGGTLVLEAGRWQVNGPLRLYSGVGLHLCQGCEVRFSGEPSDYLPLVLTRWEGTDLWGYSPCIYALNASDVAISGQGTLSMDLTGSIQNWRRQQGEAQRTLRRMGADGIPLEQRVFGEGRFLRPSFIQFLGCSRVLVEGIHIHDVPFWALHVLYSEHATIRGISVKTYLVNNDGVDIDSSRHVVVEQCRFTTGDDCIAIKSGRDRDGRVVGKPSEDIVIRDCRMFRSKAAGVALGSEMSGGIRRVYIIRCRIDEADVALNVKSNLDRGGVIEYLRVWNVAVDACDELFQITTQYHGYRGEIFPPLIHDIEIDDVRCGAARSGISIIGAPLAVIRDVRVQDLEIAKVKEPLTLQLAEDIKLSAVFMNGRPVYA